MLKDIKFINCNIIILTIKIRNHKPPLLPAPSFFSTWMMCTNIGHIPYVLERSYGIRLYLYS